MADPKKSKLELVKEAQQEVQTLLTEKRIALLKDLQEFEDIGGADDVASGIMDILDHFKVPVTYLFFHTVFPDSAFNEALKALEKADKVQTQGKKGDRRVALKE